MTAHVDKNKKRVFLVDDHPLVREWLTNLINQQPDLTVCGEAESAPQAIGAIAATKPDVVIVDISLKDSSGIELIKDLKQSHPDCKVLVLSMHDESHYAARALRAGARGYVMKRETTRKVIDAIRRILEGKVYVSDKVTEIMAAHFVQGKSATDHSPVEQLSDRERSVLRMRFGLDDGRERTLGEIGEELGVSRERVRQIEAEALQKLRQTDLRAKLKEYLE